MSLIEMNSLSKVFKKEFSRKEVQALKSLTLNVEEGEVFGFLGPNGAGKSTTIKILLNLIRPTSGSLSIDGRDVSDSEVRRLIGYLPENPYFYDHLSAKELLWFGGKSCDMDDPIIQERTEALLKELDLLHAMKRPLSHIQQRHGVTSSYISKVGRTVPANNLVFSYRSDWIPAKGTQE